MFCPKCGKDAGEAKYCPECGEILTQEFIAINETNFRKKKKKKGCFFALLIPVILCVIVCILFVVGIKVGFIQFEDTAKTTQVEYTKAEDFDVYNVMFYEASNDVKRKAYLEEIKSKRYRFYLIVLSIKDEHSVLGQLCPSDDYYLDISRAKKTLNQWVKTGNNPDKEDYINCIYWRTASTEVVFDDEIWDSLKQGDKLMIEGSFPDSPYENDLITFDSFSWNPSIENAVIVSKNGVSVAVDSNP